MKYLHYAVSGLLLTVSAAAQMAPSASPSATPSTATTPQSTTPSPAVTPKISSLGGDDVKGPEHPLTLDQMKALYDAMGYQKILDQRRDSVIAQQKQRAPFMPQDVWDDLTSSWDKVDYPGALLDVYKKYISTEDAAKLIEFSKTDAGKHYFESLPATTQAVPAAIGRPQQQVFQQVGARHKDEIEAAQKKYQAEHQPKPAPSLGPVAPTTPSGSTAPAKPATTPATPSTSTTPAPTTPPASTTPQN